MPYVQGIGKELEINMSQMESVSFNTYRKQGHPQNSEQGQPWEETNRSDTLNVFDNSESRTPTLIIENHPNDSRVKIRENTVQTLNGRMGTGGVTYRCVWRIA